MKRIYSRILLSVLLTIALLFSAMLAVSAADAPIIEIETANAAPGDTATVGIYLKNNPGVTSVRINVGYDATVLRLSGISYNLAEMGGQAVYPENLDSTNGQVTLYWADNFKDYVADGLIAELTFTVSADVEPGKTYELTASYNPDDIFNVTEDNVAFEVKNGSITVIDCIPGDINGDRVVNTKDATRLMRYYANWQVEVNEPTLDVNGDGILNTKDTTRLMRYLANWDVEIFCACSSSKECKHSMTAVAEQTATCTEDGNIAYWCCAFCKKYFADAQGKTELSQADTVIPATGHGILTHNAAKEPTCTQTGNSEYWYCGTCNGYYADADGKTALTEVFVAAKGHTYSKEWSFDQTYHWRESICEHTGLISDKARHTIGSDKLCTVCGGSDSPDPTKPYRITYKLVEYNKHQGDSYLETLSIDNSKNREWFSGTESFELEDPSCGDAYAFNGWYTEDGEKVTKISAGTKQDITLYARWTERTFTVTYNVYNTPVAAITDESKKTYKPSQGLADLPNPEIYNYVFLGWYTNDGVEVKEIPVGTTGNVVLNPYLTSKRNLTKAVKSLEDPIIIENSDDGVIYFTYEIGTIENVPLSDAIWTIQSVAGLAQQKSETVTTSISKEKATEIADTISKSTVDSATWTLSKDWNDVTSVSEEWAEEKGMTVEEANEMVKTESGTFSFTTDNGGCKTTTTTDGTTTVEYNSQNNTHGTGAEINAKISGSYSNSKSIASKVTGSVEIGAEISGGFKMHEETNEHTGTDETKVKSEVKADTTSWNKSKTSSETKSASQSESVRNALSEIISNTKGYGKTYSSGGENSEAQEFSTTDSKSVSSSSALTYFSSETKTTTTTYSTDGKNDGCYRLVVAGTVHVFGVVGYDVATQSYFTYTFNVLDDKTHEFLDYSPNLSFDDYQNGVIPFEVPFFVYEYVTGKTVVTEGLGYITDSATGTAKVTSFGENVGTNDEPDWVYPSLDVVIPSYIASGGNAYKVTGITANAFAGKPIRSIILSDYITQIPANAFKDCTALQQISGRFTTIGDNAFSGCTALEGFTISSRTTVIGKNAFAGVATLKMNALYAEYAPTNAAEVTQKVIQSAVESGARNVTVDISKIAEGTVLTLDVPAIDGFELIGNKKVTCTDLKITSFAKNTKLCNLTISNCTRVPLEIKDGDLVLDTVHITAPNFVLLLAKDGATVSLLRDSKLVAQGGNAVVAKNPQIESRKDENVWGSLRVAGNFYYCGNEPDMTYMTMDSGKLILLTETEFLSYIQGCFKLTFNPNGGSVEKTGMTVFVGQPVGSLPVPSRTGYNFVAWTDENGATVTENSVFTTVKDVTLTAKWSAKAYKATWNTGTGYSITVNRTSSPYASASTGNLKSGAVVYYGDVLSVTYAANTGYSLTGQGKTSITVTCDVTSADIFTSAKVNTYTVSWKTGTGYTITVKRTSSPLQGAGNKTLSNGETVYYGDVLSVTYAASVGYSLGSKGATAVTVTGNITSSHIYASATLNSYTYYIIYKSSNDTPLGSATATYKYGTTNTITAPAFSGYTTPNAQIVKWDSTSAKTISFTYAPASVNNSSITGSFGGSSPRITYTTTINYRNRTETSVEVQIVTTVTMQNGWPGYAYGVAFDATCGSVSSGKVQVAGYKGLSTGGSTCSGSSGWITIPLNTTDTTTVSFNVHMYNTNWQNNSSSNSDYRSEYYTWNVSIPAY